jgi:glutaconate CoA-transferase subunit B
VKQVRGGNGRATAAESLVAAMAREIRDGDVIATGVASPLPILAIEVARRTHAPNLTYLACVGSLDPEISTLRPCSEDLTYLDGRTGEVSIPDLFDHARRGRVDVMFFGAAEVDGSGDTNLTAAGSIEEPSYKFPGVAGAATLRRWVLRPVLVVSRQSRRNLVPKVQIASTSDRDRSTRLLTDLGTFELGRGGAKLLGRQPCADAATIREHTGFEFAVADPLSVIDPPGPEYVKAIRSIDEHRLCEQLVGHT